jgi:methionine-rich copper-binding protein CopC
MSKGNDVILLQQTSTAIVGAGEGNDRYVLDSALLAPNQKITISDTQDSNSLHLVGGLTITGSKVTNDALLLTLSNGAEVTLLGANTFQFLTGGNPLTGQGAQTSTFTDFVTKDLGYASVPAPGNVVQSSTTVTVNNTGGTSVGGGGGTSGGGSGGGQTFTLTPASGQVTEGTALSFTLKAAQEVAADTTFTVVITGDDNGGTLGKASAADFPADVVSSVTIKAGSDSATFDLTPVASDGTEGIEGFKVTLLDSANKAVANSGVVVIKDGVTDTTPPVIDANQSFTYAENQAKGFVVGTVKASDVGVGGGAGTIATFEIVGGNDNGFFSIDKDGKITLTEAGADKTKAANDFETAPNTFTLKVRAIDAAGNKSADTDVTLTVTDVDDIGPKFVSAAASDTQVKINFDEPLKTVALSNPSALFTVTQGGTSYSVNTATISGSTVTLTLASALGSGDTYIAYNGTVLEDALGNKADKIASTKVTFTDITPPTLTSSNPADDATDFPANANLTLTFDEAVKLGTGTITLVNTSDATDTRVINVQDATQVSVSGNTVTINPTADLKVNASYAVNISPTAILDSAGNAFAGISDNTTLNFTTTPPSTPGQTFTLTAAAGADYADTNGSILAGGQFSTSGFKFTAGNETIYASTASINNGVPYAAATLSGDVLLDGSTTDNDVIKLTLTGSTNGLNATNVETLEITATNTVAAALNLQGFAGLKTITVTGSPTAALTLADNLANDLTALGVTTVNASGVTSVGGAVIANNTNGTGAITFTGGAGADVFIGGASADAVNGGAGADRLCSGNGNDTVSGGAGADIIDGGNGNDTLNGNADADIIIAGAGNDTIQGGAGNDVIVLGTVNYAAAAAVNAVQVAFGDLVDGGDEVAAYANGQVTFNDTGTGGDLNNNSGTLDITAAMIVAAATAAAGNNTVKFEATAAGNGNDTIYQFQAGNAAAGGDILDVSAFLGAPVALTTVATNDALADNVTGFNVVTINTTLAGAGAAITYSANSKYVVIEDADANPATGDSVVRFITTDANGAIASNTAVATLVGLTDPTTLIAFNFA